VAAKKQVTEPKFESVFGHFGRNLVPLLNLLWCPSSDLSMLSTSKSSNHQEKETREIEVGCGLFVHAAFLCSFLPPSASSIDQLAALFLFSPSFLISQIYANMCIF
jgi:hypothetical protein